MIPKFNRFEFLKRVIKQNLERKECKVESDHLVMPETIERKLKERNFRFMERCIYCKATIGFDCTYDDDNNLKINKRLCRNLQELQRYFNDISDNNYQAPHVDDHRILIEACQICQGRSVAMSLCQDHLLEVLLHLKLKDTNMERAIAEIQTKPLTPSPESQVRIVDAAGYLLRHLKGDDLTAFLMTLPELIRGLKVQRYA